MVQKKSKLIMERGKSYTENEMGEKPVCNHDFREFWKTNFWGRLVLKEIRCIICNKKK